MRTITLIGLMLISALTNAANGLPDCSEVEEFKSSTHGMLLSELLPIDVGSPEKDAKIRFENGDYRLLGYGSYSGIKIPGSELLEKNELCKYGVNVLQGITDAFESSEHRVLVEQFKSYIKKYNAYLVGKL